MIESVPLQQVDRTYVRVSKRKLSYFSGCDYFRLASHPKVQAAVAREVVVARVGAVDRAAEEISDAIIITFHFSASRPTPTLG